MHDLGTDLSGFSGPKGKIGIFPLSHIQAKPFWSILRSNAALLLLSSIFIAVTQPYMAVQCMVTDSQLSPVCWIQSYCTLKHDSMETGPII